MALKDVKITGYLNLIDEDFHTSHPLADVEVEVYRCLSAKNVGTKWGSFHTDNNGYFSCTVKNLRNTGYLYLVVRAESTYVKVSNTGKVFSYKEECEKVDITNKSSIDLSHDFKEPSKFAKALHVLLMMRACALFVKDQFGIEPDFVRCNYPMLIRDDDDNSCAWNNIRLKENHWNGTVVLHEYGHCFQKMIGVKIERNPVKNHSVDEDATEEREKYIGLYEAFLEGFASFFEIAVINTYKDTLLSDFACCNHTDDFEFQHHYDSNAYHCYSDINCRSGESVEIVIISILTALCFKFKSIYETELKKDPTTAYIGNLPEMFSNDETISFKELLTILKDIKNEFTFYNFSKKFEEKYKYKNEKIIEKFRFLLTLGNVSPSRLTVKEDDESDICTISFNPGGTSAGQASRGTHNDWIVTYIEDGKEVQNKFTVNIFDSEKKLIKHIETDKPTCSFDRPAFGSIKPGAEKYFYVSIKGKSEGNSYTTEYTSGLWKLKYKNSLKEKTIVNVDDIKTGKLTKLPYKLEKKPYKK